MKRSAKLIAGLVAMFASVGSAAAQDPYDLGPQPPGRFDFYVLSLTWVPTFCAQHQAPGECGRGLGFGLHGLWPESINGYPSFCTQDPLPSSIGPEERTTFANPDEAGHEWSKHGTCTGLDPDDYIAEARNYEAAFAIPPDLQQVGMLQSAQAPAVESEFLAANPGLTPASIVSSCAGHLFNEIHICLAKDGSPRACEPWERREANCR